MSAVAVAVASAALGALLAGAARLRLAQRTERRAARAGAGQVDADLESAEELIRAHLGRKAWWDALATPSTAAWDIYESALIAQLPSERITQLQRAVRVLHDVNVRAGLARQTYARAEARYQQKRDAEIQSRAQRGVVDPQRSVKEDEKFQRELEKAEPSLSLADVDCSVLEEALDKLREAREALANQDTAARLSERQPWWPRLELIRARSWELVVIAGLVAAVLVVSWELAPEGKVSTGSVATALGTRLSGKPSLECEALPGQAGSAWMCLATYKWGTCPASASISRRASVVSAAFVVQPWEQRPQGCGGLEGYEIRTISNQRAANADQIMASGGRLEADDPRSVDETPLSSGMVRTPVDNPTDIHRIVLPKPAKRAWWEVWK